MVYLDASVIVALFARQPLGETVARYLDACTSELAISDFAAGEVSSAFSRLVRMGAMAANDAHVRLKAFDAWRGSGAPVRLTAGDVKAADDIVRQFALALRLPDAIHLAMAHRLGAQLLTDDARMVTAARELKIVVADWLEPTPNPE